MSKINLLVILMLVSNLAYNQTGLIDYKATPSFEGYTLFPSFDMVYLVDNCGRLVHEWSCGNDASLATYLMEDGNLLFMSKLLSNNTFTGGGGGGGRLEIYSPNNNLIWQYDYYLPNQYCLHHDVEPLPNGNILAIVWVQIPIVTALAEGKDPATLSNRLWVEKIIEIQPIGSNDANIVWEWNVMNHLIQDYDAAKNNYGIVADNPQLLDFNAGNANRDWIHFNSIDYHQAFDQILLSSRHLNEIFVIDHSTTTAEATGHTGGNYGKGGDFLYRYGNPQNYKRGTDTDKVLYSQHDARWIKNGYSTFGEISIFNNGVGRSIGSTVDIISLPVNSFGNYISLSTGQSYPPNSPAMEYSLGPSSTNGSFYSPNQGGAQILPNGNVLICNATQVNYFEVNKNDTQILWEYKNPKQGTTFKVNRYSPNYPGLQYLDLTPMGTLESPPSAASGNCTVESNCAPNLIQNTQALIAVGVYQVANFIKSNGRVANSTNVSFKAGQYIELSNHFEVKAGAEFEALIGACL